MSVVVSGRTRESQDLHSTPTHTTPSTLIHISHLPPRLILPPRSASCTTSAAHRGTHWASRHTIRARPGKRPAVAAAKSRCGAQRKKGTCVHALLTCTLAPSLMHARTHGCITCTTARKQARKCPTTAAFPKGSSACSQRGVASLARLCSSLAARGW